MVHDVGLGAPRTAVEPRHVHAIEVDAPDRDPVQERSGHVAEAHPVAVRPVDSGGPDQVPRLGVGVRPHCVRHVGAATHPVPQFAAYGAGDAAVVVPEGQGLSGEEDPVLFGDDGELIHLVRMSGGRGSSNG